MLQTPELRPYRPRGLAMLVVTLDQVHGSPEEVGGGNKKVNESEALFFNIIQIIYFIRSYGKTEQKTKRYNAKIHSCISFFFYLEMEINRLHTTRTKLLKHNFKNKTKRSTTVTSKTEPPRRLCSSISTIGLGALGVSHDLTFYYKQCLSDLSFSNVRLHLNE